MKVRTKHEPRPDIVVEMTWCEAEVVLKVMRNIAGRDDLFPRKTTRELMRQLQDLGVRAVDNRHIGMLDFKDWSGEGHKVGSDGF